MTMEKRDSKRITAGYKARIICGEKTCLGLIENLSESGISVMTDPGEVHVDLSPGNKFDLVFETISGEILNLHCKIKWSDTVSPHNVRSRIGAVIIDPPWEKIATFL
jgi:hypothetical protein